jgi:hypothetical protein
MSDHDTGHGGYVRKVLDESRRYVQELLDDNNQMRTVIAGLEVQLKILLRQVDEENQRRTEEFTQLQVQTNNLANLYVATYRLHGTLERGEVLESIREIVANLIGSEEMGLFDVDWTHQALVLVDSNGIDPARYRSVPMSGGLIGAAVRTGKPLVVDSQVRGPGEETLTAVIPLQLAGTITGAIAIFSLLPQKARFEDLDRELFDLLASHAAMALHSTELHAARAQQPPGRGAGTGLDGSSAVQ